MTTFKIHGTMLFWCTTILCTITGHLTDYFLFISLILIHEFGHAFVALLFHWKIKEITLYPFGGITKLEAFVNSPMKEELLILLAGPITQILYFHIFCFFFKESLFFKNMHYLLLSFNLLPIYPLDGGKLLFLIYQSIFPFLKSHQFILRTSILVLTCVTLFLFFQKSSLILILSCIFLFFSIQREKKEEPYLFHKFITERILYSFSFPFLKKIQGFHIKKMYRDHEHIFVIGENEVREKEALSQLTKGI